MVESRSTNHPPHLVSVATGIGEPLQQHHAAAFGADVAICIGIKGFATAVGREHPGLLKGVGEGRGQQQVDPRGDGLAAFPSLKAAHGLMHGHQGGGTGRIDRQGGPTQIELIRKAIGRDAVGVASAPIDAGCPFELAVVVAADAHKHPGGAASPAIWRDACVLEGFPGGFQQQALLGIHLLGFAGGNPKERSIESIDALEVARPGGRGPAKTTVRDRGRLGAAHAAAAFPQQVPEGFGAGRPGQAAGHAHHGNIVVAKLPLALCAGAGCCEGIVGAGCLGLEKGRGDQGNGGVVVGEGGGEGQPRLIREGCG